MEYLIVSIVSLILGSMLLFGLARTKSNPNDIYEKGHNFGLKIFAYGFILVGIASILHQLLN